VTIEKWQAFEASFEGNPEIEFYLEARGGSKPYIEIPAPHNHVFEPGEFSVWAMRTMEQLVSITGKPIDAGICARNRNGPADSLPHGTKKVRQRFSPERTPFQEIRDTVAAMAPDERAMWVKAVAIEEAHRMKGQARLMENGKPDNHISYAWNRVARACDEATNLEKIAEGQKS